ncbi:MAG: hypothetical protein ACK4TO_00785 [Candidatus Nitrosotenuis sp.]
MRRNTNPRAQHNAYKLDPSNIFVTSEAGYSIVSTKDSVGQKYGWIKII